MVLGPIPGHALADMQIERGRRDGDRFLQRCLCFLDAVELAEPGEVAVGWREIGERKDRPVRCLSRALVGV